MSGGYFSCGDWQGGDKSATAFFEVIDRLASVLTVQEGPAWDADFVAPLRAQLNDADEDDPPYVKLSRLMLDVLIPPARRYYDQLREQLGNPPRDSWRETDEGWELMCLADLFCAYDASMDYGKPVSVHFD